MKFILPLLVFGTVFFLSCAANQKSIRVNEKFYTVKVINTSYEKVLLRYQHEEEGYSFRFVDPQFYIKFRMQGKLILQYNIENSDDAKIISIQQDTLIHIKPADIVIDDLPIGEKIIPTPEPSKSSK